MKSISEPIYINAWLDLKPYKKESSSDLYYLNLSNKVKRALLNEPATLTFIDIIGLPLVDYLSCFLTAYMEDLVSETNLWNAFVRLHKHKYNKPIPFYELSDYYEEEINVQDIRFLIWYFLDCSQDERFVSPMNKFITAMAEQVMEVFEEEWEYAPENERLKSYYKVDETESDFYDARELIDIVLFQSYLFHPDTGRELIDQINELIEEKATDENLLAYVNDTRDHHIHHVGTKLLAIKGKDWVAEILGATHPLSSAYLEMSPKIMSKFFYKGQDRDSIFLEHIASGRTFHLKRASYEMADRLDQVDDLLIVGLVKWKNEWWCSGVNAKYKFNTEMVEEERNSPKAMEAIAFLEDKSLKHQSLKKQYQNFLSYNDESAIAFMMMKDVEPFVEDFIKFHNDSLVLSVEDRKAFEGREVRRIDMSNSTFGQIEPDIPCLVYFDAEYGLQHHTGLSAAFPLEHNPYFTRNEDELDEVIDIILFSPTVPPELAEYFIAQAKSGLEFFQTDLGKLVLSDQDFLMRCFKSGHYTSRPYINSN